MRCLFRPLAEVLLQCSHCSVVQIPFGRSSLGLLVLQFLRPYSFIYEGSDHTQRACSSQIHSYSTVLLLAFDYLHTLASFFFSLNIECSISRSVSLWTSAEIILSSSLVLLRLLIFKYQCHMIS